MKRQIFISTTAIIIALTINVNAQTKTDFKVDPAKSKVNWIGTKPGGQHHGAVNISDGILTLEKSVISTGTFTINLLSITDLDMEPGTWNDKLTAHLKSEDFFYTEKFPNSIFKITKATKKDNSKYSITGDLTIRGITHPVTFDAIVLLNNGVLTAKSSEIVLDRVKWDVKAMSKSVFADLKDKYVDDEMRVTIELTANSK